MQKRYAEVDEDGNPVEDAQIQEEDSEDEKDKHEGSDSEESVDEDYHEEDADMNLDNEQMMMQGEDMDDIDEFDGQVNFDVENEEASLN